VIAADVKQCCADAYASGAARFLLGDTFHPGGAALTRQLARALRLGPGDVVADVASGPGTSALLLARETGCDIVGIDLSVALVESAERAAAEAGLDGRVRFVVGDAEALPLGDESVDGVLCECAFCTFPEKGAAAAELARVLRPGSRLALSDVTADHGRLGSEVNGLAAHVACLAGAAPLEETARLLDDAGLAVERCERHDGALAALLDRVEARLRLVRPAARDLPVDRALELLTAARSALGEGALGYGAVVARKR
jgi:arsenite methyltransferase